MRSPAIREASRRSTKQRSRLAGPAPSRQQGVTMVLVAMAMIAIIAMAAMSIDVVTLYLAREEAQRSADAGALAAARVLSVSGITGTANPSSDPASWTSICGGSNSVASQTAQAVAIQNGVGNSAPTTVQVTYSAGGVGPAANCSALPAAFAVNPMVTVQVTRSSLPTFFSRIWGRSGNSVSATATAEAFNPSDSGAVGNGPLGTITPVLPRCVKPWVVPNHNPLSPAPNCLPFGGTRCNNLVNTTDASISNPGISLNGGGPNVIGENFWLVPDCNFFGATCAWRTQQPQANYITGSTHIKPPPNLQYLPGLVGTPSSASPTCTGASAYQRAITGCDQSTNYQCGSHNANTLDLSENPASSHDTRDAVQCLIRQSDDTNFTSPSGQDTLNPFAAPSSFPFEIDAGSSTPLAGLAGKPISSSNSIVSLPIYDDTQPLTTNRGLNTVTYVGFLQVFINAVDQFGNINVTILNVSGCSDGTSGRVGSPALGSSPVPVRLITPP